VAPANDDFKNDRCFAGVAPLHVDLEVRHSAQQIRIKRADSVAADIMGVPRLVVVARRDSERRHDTVEVVPVFQRHVLFHEPEAQQLLFRIRWGHAEMSPRTLLRDGFGILWPRAA
jgi:hypothetical protein